MNVFINALIRQRVKTLFITYANENRTMKLFSSNQGNTGLSHDRITRDGGVYRLSRYETGFKDRMYEIIGFDSNLLRIIASAIELQVSQGTALPLVLMLNGGMNIQAQDVAAVAGSHADTAATACAVNADPHG